MAHLIAKHLPHHVNLAFALGVVWIGFAVAVAIYDVGRWLTAW